MRGRAHYTVLAVVTIFVMVGPLLSGQITAEARVAKPSAYNLYFGDLHAHTGYSDAYVDSTPWDAYKAAIAGGADFMALTDHAAIWHGYEAWILDQAEWEDTLAAADYYTSKNFVAMAGYEAWLLANLGEINVYNIQKLPDTGPQGAQFDRLENFYDWLASQPGAIGQFNHPLYVSDNFQDYSYYTKTRDIGMNILEVYNDEYTEDSYIMALDAGWHVMPSANSDTHYPDWISGHEMRTVLLAESLTPANLYAAMSASRGYGTLDKNLEISFKVNGAVMGSTMSAPGSTCMATIHVEDPDRVASDRITLLEIVSDGGVVVASMPAHSTTVDWTVSLDTLGASYFYLRVTTASALSGGEGVTAWTAPVWTGL